jgi:hypothetical protein
MKWFLVADRDREVETANARLILQNDVQSVDDTREVTW